MLGSKDPAIQILALIMASLHMQADRLVADEMAPDREEAAKKMGPSK